MKAIGIDGCRAGWFAVILDNNHWDIAIYPSIASLCETHTDASCILIDIPIGLPGTSARACDGQARKHLSPRRHSSVFPVPCRDAVCARDYLSACAINQAKLGKKLTKQTWNICNKIAEVDGFLRQNPRWIERMYESHPEICFWALNQQTPMAYAKKKEAGQTERLKLLTCRWKEAPRLFDAASLRFKQKDLVADDILDAIALTITATKAATNRLSLPATPPIDEYGLPMQIVYSIT